MAETKTCQNCHNPFTITPDDFDFYKKLGVPPPTFCRECRLQRHMAFRNERTLYKRKCDAPGHTEESFSVFSPDKNERIYDHKMWWGDSWDPLQYGKNVDFTKPFMQQVRDLWREVPDMAVLNINPVNSDYCSITEGNKNCYLVVGGDFNENAMYSSFIFNSRESVDVHWVSKSEFNYETIDCVQCSRLIFSRYCDGCYNGAFLFNCRNCHDCFGCTNLVSKSYCIFNTQYSKEEYEKRMAEFDMGSYKAITELREKYKRESLRYPRRFARMLHCTNSTGDNLEETKNCRISFEVFGGAEDCAYIWLAYSAVKNCADLDHFGQGSENSYECSTIYPGNRVFFSKYIFSCHDVQYSYNCHNSSNLFGCVGLRSKQYCILNKQYSKEEYEELMPKIVAHMKEHPYRDKKGRTYAYGEFFPAELSPFCYNETIAQEYFPLTRDGALAAGYGWKEQEKREYNITKESARLPDNIKEVEDALTGDIIACVHKGACTHQCTAAFRIISQELGFYRQMNLPLPRLCPNCRYYGRINERNPLKLWHRKCDCLGAKSSNGVYVNTATHLHGANRCPSEFETSYAPDRPEIVYCEACYQSEVA